MSDQYEVGTLEDAEKFAIDRMARQAGLDHYLTVRDFPGYLEQFYKLAFAAGAASKDENADYLEGYEIGYGEGRNHMRDDIIKACEQYEFNVQGLLRVIKDL